MLQKLKQNSEVSTEDFFLPDFFEGRTSAWGFFEDPFGKVKRAFTAEIEGSWEENEFVLDESFVFLDGTTDHRVWRLRFEEGSSKFSATCGDSIGPGQGYHVRGGCYLTYRVNLPIGERKVAVRFKDLFHLIDEQTLLNRAKVSKWGLPVGQLTIAFKR